MPFNFKPTQKRFRRPKLQAAGQSNYDGQRNRNHSHSKNKNNYRNTRGSNDRRPRNNNQYQFKHELDDDNKIKRRGVSVFQRQLFKRKKWVEQYEDGKDQKRRDQRKVMRTYYKALKDLNREHIQMFGHSISNHKKKGKVNNYNMNAIKKRDVWNELRHPKYDQRYKQSNWDFLDTKGNDTKATNADTTHHEGSSHHPRNSNGRYNHNNAQHNRNQQNTYSFARKEGNLKRMQMRNERNNAQILRAQQQKEFAKKQKQRERRDKIMRFRTKKGQPCLNAQMILVLEQIQHKERMQKEKQQREKENAKAIEMEAEKDALILKLQQNGRLTGASFADSDQEEDEDADEDVNYFLEDSD